MQLANFCLLLDISVMFGFFSPLVPPGSGSDGREWELGKCAMFCWRLWTEGLKEQLCRESQHPALYCTSPVIIEVIIEVVFWPLKPAELSGSHSAQCAVLLSFAGPVCSQYHDCAIDNVCGIRQQTMASEGWPVHPTLRSRVQGNFVKKSCQWLFNLMKKTLISPKDEPVQL